MQEADFKDAVRRYIIIHDELAELSKQIRDIRKKKDALGDQIITFMKSLEINECQLTDGRLVRKTTKKVATIKKEHILAQLKTVIDDVRATDVLAKIFNNREVSNKDCLQRLKNKMA